MSACMLAVSLRTLITATSTAKSDRMTSITMAGNTSAGANVIIWGM